MRIVFFLFLSLLAIGLQGQTDSLLYQSDSLNNSRPQNISKGRFDDTKLLYRKEIQGGGHLHTNGWGLNVRVVKNLNLLNKTFWNFEFDILKHPKEYKLTPFNEDAKKYVFGKKNALGSIKVSYGRQKILFGKEARKGVQISNIYSFGGVLGILKPVYLEIAYPNTPGNEDIRFEKYNEEIHTQGQINGRGPILKGIEELALIPGGSAKWALNFEYANDDNIIRAIEAGAMLDVFYKKVPIMAFTDNHQFFLNLYVSFQFGKKMI
ncbi:MAG: hypothetical protein MRY83_20745 [Flavobacteriales bacterium]|nr:hypothetical protein [Flavobacteriales bacterium]